MAVAFRCDSSTELGSGHVMRCLSLASRIRKYDPNISFYCQKLPGNVAGLIEKAGFSVRWVENEDFETAPDLKLFVIDHYNLDALTETKFRKKAPVFVIDDLHNRKHDCDYLLDTTYRENKNVYENLVPPTCRMFLGPQYSLLREEFIKTKRNLKNFTKKYDFFVFFGGTDYSGETLRFLNNVETTLKVAVIVGTANSKINEIKNLNPASNIHIYIQPDNVAELLAQSQFYFGSGGTVTWERLYLELNGVVFSVAENQKEINQNLAKLNLQIDGGDAQKADYQTLFKPPSDLLKVPSDFVNYLPEAILKSIFTSDITIGPANPRDSDFLFALRNDDLTRKMSKTSEVIPKEKHEAWFSSKMNSTFDKIYIGLKGDEEFGQFRVDSGGLVNVAVTEKFRGQGLGSMLIRKGIETYARDFLYFGPFKAEIKKENIASVKAFEEAGFVKKIDGDLQVFFCSI